MQMICALLVFRTADLPRPLAELSPWLDWLIAPKADVYRELGLQQHRRFIKTHTPLDGVPLDPRAMFVVVARNPLDMAVSLYHQGENLDRRRMSELTGQPLLAPVRDDLGPWLRRWIGWDGDPVERLDSLPGVLWHLTDAWNRRHETNVVLVHFDDLIADLATEMKRIAAALGFDIEAEVVDELSSAATFSAMKANSDMVAPDPAGVLKDRSRFFRRGRSGSALDVLTPDDLGEYRARAAALAPADWLHCDR